MTAEARRPDARADRRPPLSPTLVIGGTIVAVIVLVAVVSFFWTPWSTIFTDVDHPAAGPGTAGHLLGTDTRGRDIASLLMAGARTTLYVGILAVGIAAVIGTPLGILAGMVRRGPAELIMRVTDLMLAFPALLLALAFATIWGSSLTSAMIAIGIASIPSFVRVVRSGTVVVMTTDYVQAARVAGRRGPGIAVRHVLPNVMGLVIVQVSVSYAHRDPGRGCAVLPRSGRRSHHCVLGPDALREQRGPDLRAGHPDLAGAGHRAGRARVQPARGRPARPPRPAVGGPMNPSGTPLLTVEQLRISAGTAVLVDDVSFVIAPDERLGIIGASGSGKTLTCMAVAALLPEGLTATGSVRLAGVDTDLVAGSERRLAAVRGLRIGTVFQEPMTALNPTMTIGRQVAEVMVRHRTRTRKAARSATLDLLASTGLPDPERVARSYPHQLSGGQRQRVVLAIAIANRPDLLICDEPTTALDVTVQARVLELIAEQSRAVQAALLFISHDLAVVASICDRVLVMFEGRIVEQGSVIDVLRSPTHPHTRQLLADSDLSIPEDFR